VLWRFDVRPLFAIDVVWLIFIVAWIALGMLSNCAVRALAPKEEAPYRIAAIAAAVLLTVGAGQLEGVMGIPGWSLFALTCSGLALAWWARAHLGKLWSGAVTLKEEHRVISTGPYGIVRHPIYTGIGLGLLATALAQDRWQAILAFTLFAISFWLKTRVEEAFLRRQLGAEIYDSYAKRVPMLIPFWPRKG